MTMALSSRSLLELRKLGRPGFNCYHKLNSGSLGLQTLGGVNYNNQIRHQSSVSLPSVTDFVTPTSQVAGIFSEFAPVLKAQELLCQLHDATGLTWAPTIIASTIVLRLLMGLPISVIQQKVVAKLKNCKPEMDQVFTDLQREAIIAAKVYNWDVKKAEKAVKHGYKREVKRIVTEHNCHPLRPIALVSLQLPVWICISGAIRNIATMLPLSHPDLVDQQIRFMEMAIENPAWIETLVAPDPFLLPGLFVLVNFINYELHSLRGVPGPTHKYEAVARWVSRGIFVGLGVFATYMPSALTLYWVSSSVGALVITATLKINPIRSALGLPAIPLFSSLKSAIITKPKFKIPFLRKAKTEAI